VGIGLARGYQKRWVQILSQGGPTALPDNMVNPTEMDTVNREVFDEYFEVMVKAWTQDAFDFNGKHYQVPFPYDEGIAGWAGVDWTRRFGAEGEIDDEGIIRKVGVVPRPYQTPHPPVFVPFTASPSTLISAARRGATPFMFTAEPNQFRHWCEVYRDEAAKAGRNLKLGQCMGSNKSIAIGDTYEEAFELAVGTTGFEYHNYFNKFGFAEVFRTDADDPDKPVTFKDEVEVTKRMIDLGHQLCGTVDDIKRQMEGMHRCYSDDGELEWINWNFFYQGTHSMDVQERQLDLFMNKVMPEFRSSSYDEAPVASPGATVS
jgi:alkanesulfonate monooxygenase SsuD/methylene tetrahydromethanopterin reductase-like flavin-dependent oxidoreductase (luciferase family)